MKTASGIYHAMGTLLRIRLQGDTGPEVLNRVKAHMIQKIQQLENLLSLYQDPSEISRINAAAGDHPVSVSRETFCAVQAAVRFAALTGGACDPTVYPILRLWAVYKSEGKIPDERARQLALERMGYHRVELDAERQTVFLKDKGMGLDLGWIGKGFALDQARAVAEAAPGVARVMMDFGGHLVFWDRRPPVPQRVLIDVPGYASNQLPSFMLAENASVSTTSQTERGPHVIDPRCGIPSNGLLSVSVVAPTATEADALSTALFVLGSQEGTALLQNLSRVRAIFLEIPRHVAVG